jgi:GTP:adenosylcobinamide-phosphate guanylyltransferase
MSSTTAVTALVLAGERPGGDPLALAEGVPHKVLIPVAGVPMLARVLRSLRQSRHVGPIVVCGLDPAAAADHPELEAQLRAAQASVVAGRATPAESVLHAIEGLPMPVLVTTGDHPLLATAAVDEFYEAASSGAGADVAVGLVAAPLVDAAFPSTRRTYLRFRDGAYCGCNLFLLLTADAARAVAAWRRVERYRKQPWRMVRALGLRAIVAFLLGRLTLDETLHLASEKMGVRVRAILLRQPEAAVDVDKPSDLRLVESVLKARRPAPE